jgi:RNA polymerase sigma-70 factor (ECF subfamily)
MTQPRPNPNSAVATDADALRALAGGDIGALGVLYDRHRAAIFQFAARALGNAADVEDVVHATFLTATKAAASFDGRETCRPWLVGIAARLIHRRRRGLFRFSRALAELSIHEAERSLDPASQLGARDQIARLDVALRHLSEAKRLVLLMSEVEGLSCQEVAKALEIPVGTVWTRLHHARKDLLQLLQEGDS